MKIKSLIALYLKELKILNRSPLTIRNIKNGLGIMMEFFESERIVDLDQINVESLRLYQEEMTYKLTDKGQPLSARTREKYLCCVRGLLVFLYDQDYMATDLSRKVKLPSQPRRLPKVILDIDEVRLLLNTPNVQTNDGYRNKAILSILYDTAIRAAEMAAVRLEDIDLSNGYLTVRSGKGDKDRVLPLSPSVCDLIQNYILIVRPALITGKDDGYLILNRWGTKMTPNAIWAVVKKVAKDSCINKNVSTHTFRHSTATHMLRNGAPIRHIQELLGHGSLESTQIYTKVTINDLKEVHSKFHPSDTF